MRTVSLSLPDSLHTQIKQLARRDGVSINQMIASAAAEKVAALLTEEYLQTRADRASQARFRAVLQKVPADPAGVDDPA